MIAARFPALLRDRRRLRLIVAGALGALVLSVVLIFAVRAANKDSLPVPLLERGAFAVRVPELKKPPQTAPSAAPAASDEPRRSSKGKPSQQAPAKKKERQTGPGGIYIPPPSDWF
jgi:hypothetical protein